MNDFQRACLATAVARFPRFIFMVGPEQRAWWFDTFWKLRDLCEEAHSPGPPDKNSRMENE